MSFGKTLPLVRGGATVAFAERFRIDLVLFAYKEVIDALTNAHSGGLSGSMTSRMGSEGPFLWPNPAKVTLTSMWLHASEFFGATGERFQHAFREGPVCCSAYLLGKQWLIIDPATGSMATSVKLPAEQLDTTPIIDLYEKDLPGKIRLGLTRPYASKVSDTLVPLAERLRLNLIATAKGKGNAKDRIVLTLKFPSDTYGAGKEWMHVRCLTPDGQEVQLKSQVH